MFIITLKVFNLVKFTLALANCCQSKPTTSEGETDNKSQAIILANIVLYLVILKRKLYFGA